MQAGKERAGQRYSILYRVINCLDCQYPKDGPLVSIYNSTSEMNSEIEHKIRML